MLIPYASDHCIESSPWLGYLLFPALVIGAFALTAGQFVPVTQYMLLLSMEVSGVVLLVFMIVTFFYLWTLGLAVCAKIGNVLYLLTLVSALAAGGLLLAVNAHSIWLLSWLVTWLAGVFVVFCPLNNVDYFIFVPPFRTCSITGVAAVILWLVTDVVLCLFLGWVPVFLLHLLALPMGMGWAALLLRFERVTDGLGDVTLRQALQGETPQGQRVWQESWSEKRKQQQAEEDRRAAADRRLKEQEKQCMPPPAGAVSGDSTRVLCQCGCILEIPGGVNRAAVCPDCGRTVHAPLSPSK